MLDIQRSARGDAELIDTAAILADLEKLAETYAGRERELRTAAAQRLKAALTAARAQAERLLLKDRHGRRCAERLCEMQDEIIRILFEFIGRTLYPAQVPSEAEHMAVVATGGYGRGLLAPGSDIDLLFLLPYKQTAWGESIAEALLYCLWDMGLKVGHATRSVSECIRQAKADMTIRTALLEARHLLGDAKLFEELTARFDKEVVQGTAPEFVAAKLAEREERHRRAGQSRYLVEPNVKDSKGGLRDLHTLFWIAKYVYRVREPEELVKRGVFDAEEYRLFCRCEDFLWSVRCNMHFVTGRAEERLSFDIQREIAVRLGYTEHPGMQDVERFMKHYFLTAKHVGDLTAILCSRLEDRQTKPAPVLSRFIARLRPAKSVRTLSESDDFRVDNNRITIARPDVFERDPINLIRMFHLAQKHNLAFDPEAMRAATHSLKLIDKDVREDKEANRLFLEILTSKNDAETVLRRMNEAGVLGAFVHAFGRIVAMMQFNMYHHYTVDEHLLRCIGELADAAEKMLIHRVVVVHVELHHRHDAAERVDECAEHAGLVHAPQHRLGVVLRGQDLQKQAVGFLVLTHVLVDQLERMRGRAHRFRVKRKIVLLREMKHPDQIDRIALEDVGPRDRDAVVVDSEIIAFAQRPHTLRRPQAGDKATQDRRRLRLSVLKSRAKNRREVADVFGGEEVVLHEALDILHAGMLGVAKPHRDLALNIEGQPLLGPAGDEMHVAADRPQKILTAAEQPIFLGVEHTALDQFLRLAHAVDVFGDPEQRVQIA